MNEELRDESEDRPVRGEMAIINRSGDKKTIWDASKPDEIEAARREFDFLKSKGYSAFSVKRDGEAGARLDRFDPQEEKIIFTPPRKGG